MQASYTDCPEEPVNISRQKANFFSGWKATRSGSSLPNKLGGSHWNLPVDVVLVIVAVLVVVLVIVAVLVVLVGKQRTAAKSSSKHS